MNLERSVSRGGTETIGHPAGGHDDVAVAAAGALVICSMKGAKLFLSSCAPVIVGGAANAAAPVYEYERGQDADAGYGDVTLDRWEPPV